MRAFCTAAMAALAASVLSTGATGRLSPWHAGNGQAAGMLERAAAQVHHSSSSSSSSSSNSHTRREQGDHNGHKFLTAKTRPFAVNGTALPEVKFDIGESYAGQIPVGDANPGAKFMFWFFPSPNPKAKKEILIWLNGGPGCSSFGGLMLENGPWLWPPGGFGPIKNRWSWHQLTNVVFVEQPVGTGFSTGNVTAQSEEDVARQFLSWWRNFVDTFNMRGYRVYIAGESYAGLYCPYIAAAMVDAVEAAAVAVPDAGAGSATHIGSKTKLPNARDYFNVAGMLIYDPLVTEDPISQAAVVPFVDYWGHMFPLNQTTRDELHRTANTCGYSSFISKYLTFPPPGPMPPAMYLPGGNDTDKAGHVITVPECDVFSQVIEAVLLLNPCWNIYHISDTCRVRYDVLGFPGTFPWTPEGATVYFQREDVQRAIHAPVGMKWNACADEPVFVDGVDQTTTPSSAHAIPKVIKHTKNVMISHGLLDFVLLSNATLLAIQNMTWGGQQGFQRKPSEHFVIPNHPYLSPISTDQEAASADVPSWAAVGIMGTTHTERGLTWVEVDLAGHMVPQYQPSAAYRQLEFLLGRVKSMSTPEPFTYLDLPTNSASRETTKSPLAGVHDRIKKSAAARRGGKKSPTMG